MADTSKLSQIELVAFNKVMDSLRASTLPESVKERAAMAAAVYAGLERGPTEFLGNYPIMQVGTYYPGSGGTLEVDRALLADEKYALNRMVEIGKPIAMLYGHDSPQEGAYIIAGDRVDGDTLYAHLFGDEFLLKGIRAGLYALSMEAAKNFKDLAYTGSDKTYRAWPTAWAALPPNTIAAIPAQEELPLGELGKIAANSGIQVVRFQTSGPMIRGANEPRKDNDMDLKEQVDKLQSTVDGLNDNIGTLVTDAVTKAMASVVKAQVVDPPEPGENEKKIQKELDDLKAENETKAEDAIKAQVEEKKKVLLARAPAGIRKVIEDKLEEKKDSPALQLAALIDFDAVIPVTSEPETGSRFRAGRGFASGKDERELTQDENVAIIRAAGALAEKEGISSIEATARIMAKREKEAGE